MRKCLLIFAMLWLAVASGRACTAAVITGKVTADGRPLIWKVRDTDNLQNCMKFFRGAKYDEHTVVQS